jgi:hypothetical protein
MIKEISEKEYRAIPKNSSSSIKDFSMDKRKYHKKHILREVKDDENADDSQAVMMGRLVETLLMEPDTFDDQFFMSSVINIPGGMMGDFAVALAKHTVANTDPDGVVAEDFMTLAEMAHKDSCFKLKLETIVEKFVGSDAEVYYNERRIVMFNGLTVITANDVNNAERIVRELRENPNTSALVTLETGGQFEVINQMKIDGFEIDDLALKSMLDKVIINHRTRTITWYDLKCTWSVEKFYKEYYLFRRAYFQAYIYQQAVKALTLDPASPFYGYKVGLPAFIVCDSINYNQPLVYDVSEKDLEDAYIGFEKRGWKYPGVKEIIDDLKWALNKDIWNISRKNHQNSGRVKLEH